MKDNNLKYGLFWDRELSHSSGHLRFEMVKRMLADTIQRNHSKLRIIVHTMGFARFLKTSDIAISLRVTWIEICRQFKIAKSVNRPITWSPTPPPPYQPTNHAPTHANNIYLSKSLIHPPALKIPIAPLYYQV